MADSSDVSPNMNPEKPQDGESALPNHTSYDPKLTQACLAYVTNVFAQGMAHAIADVNRTLPPGYS